MEDLTVEVVGESSEDEFGVGASDTNRPNKYTILVLLMGEDILDFGADG